VVDAIGYTTILSKGSENETLILKGYGGVKKESGSNFLFVQFPNYLSSGTYL